MTWPDQYWALLCPAWEYEDHPNHKPVLSEKSKFILRQIFHPDCDHLRRLKDTRATHETLFSELTPQNYSFYAGRYRGENFPCLRNCQVGIQSDNRVGYPYSMVVNAMAELALVIEAVEPTFTQVKRSIFPVTTDIERKVFCAKISAYLLETFLRIHPYINGNGHTARYIVSLVFAFFGYRQKTAMIPIEPRPTDPNYIDCIVQYRNGNVDPLEAFILRAYA